MEIRSYGRFRDFEIRDFSRVSRINPGTGELEFETIDAEEEGRYDLVKWEYRDECSPNCFSIGELTWNEGVDNFDFKSCGTRYLQYSTNELNEWLLKWIDLKAFERCKEGE